MTVPLAPERVIVSLTSIRKREAALHQTLRRLVNQACMWPYEVRVHLSHEPYLLDDGFEREPVWIDEIRREYPQVPLQVDFVRNTGPYRKLLPVLETCYTPPAAYTTVVVTCDDDTDYASDWLQRLLDAHVSGGGIVAFRGHTARLSPDGDALLPYSDWQSNPFKSPFSLANLPTGKDGVVYRPYHFDAGVFDIDTAMRVAPTADDLWFRWHTIVRGVPCRLLDLGDRVFGDVAAFDPSTSLWEAYNQGNGNDRTVNRLERLFAQHRTGTVAEMLHRYDDALHQPDPPSLGQDHSSLPKLTARQSRLSTAAPFAMASTLRAVSARSYELMRLAMAKTSASPVRCAAPRPRSDRGGLSYATDQVNRFDRTYGWLAKPSAGQTEPLVTVVMTTYNAEATVEWAAESILRQDHRSLELIIVDDLSHDATHEVLRELAARDSRVRLVLLRHNRGTYFAKNVGLMQARGEFVAFQDADDWSHPSRLRLQLWRLRSTGRSATRCNYVRHHADTNRLVRVNGRIESPGFITLMLRRDLLERVGPFDCARRAADDELISRIEAVEGQGSVDHLALPAYVALYADDSLIADSSTYSASSGLTFRLGADREHYQQAYLHFHARIKDDPSVLDLYRFPPHSIFIDKAESLRAFSDGEIAGLGAELTAAERVR